MSIPMNLSYERSRTFGRDMDDYIDSIVPNPLDEPELEPEPTYDEAYESAYGDVAYDEPYDELAGEQPVGDTVPAASNPYIRSRTPRRTIEAIDDLANDDVPTVYTHDSDISVGGMVSEGRYRRARSEMAQFQKNNRYGQYLEVPKGRRSIFAKRERTRRRRSAIAAIAVFALLALIAYLIWQFMSGVSFGSLILGEYTRPAELVEALALQALPLIC